MQYIEELHVRRPCAGRASALKGTRSTVSHSPRGGGQASGSLSLLLTLGATSWSPPFLYASSVLSGPRREALSAPGHQVSTHRIVLGLFWWFLFLMNSIVISTHLFNTFCIKIWKMFAMMEDALAFNSRKNKGTGICSWFENKTLFITLTDFP